MSDYYIDFDKYEQLKKEFTEFKWLVRNYINALAPSNEGVCQTIASSVLLEKIREIVRDA